MSGLLWKHLAQTSLKDAAVSGWIKRVRGNESAQRGGGAGVDARLRWERETDSSGKEQLRCAAAPKAHTHSDISGIYFLVLTH